MRDIITVAAMVAVCGLVVVMYVTDNKPAQKPIPYSTIDQPPAQENYQLLKSKNQP